jgi:3-phenylpropionate/cinnamic acid dioxygenase small subunit
MTSDESVDRRVRRLELVEEARATQARYADLIDAWDVDALGDVFAADAVLTAPGRRFEGLGAIQAFYRDVLHGDPSARRHFLTNVAVLDADTDVVRLGARFIYVAGTEGESIIGWGRYVDTLARCEAGVRIVSKEISVEHRGPVSASWGSTLSAERETTGS